MQTLAEVQEVTLLSLIKRVNNMQGEPADADLCRGVDVGAVDTDDSLLESHPSDFKHASCVLTAQHTDLDYIILFGLVLIQ